MLGVCLDSWPSYRALNDPRGGPFRTPLLDQDEWKVFKPTLENLSL